MVRVKVWFEVRVEVRFEVRVRISRIRWRHLETKFARMFLLAISSNKLLTLGN